MTIRHFALGFGVPLLLAAQAGCASSPRFRDAPPVWHVDDERNIAEPSERIYDPKQYFANIFVIDRVDRLLQLRDQELAHDINSIEEVPNSTWFTNRIGVRPVSAQEAARSADTGGPPRGQLSVIGAKVGGGNPGFLIQDGTGRKFLIKFDTEQNPELQTSVGVIVNRIFWTVGYNVPSDHVFDFRKEEVRIKPGATFTNAQLEKVPFQRSTLDDVLFSVARRDDGSYRAFASQLLDGKPRGGFSPHGTRDDDENDRIRHEHRRSLRGMRVLAAWVNHSDMKEDNTLDMYVTQGDRRFLKHYFLDFGESMDGHGAEKNRREDGFENFIDWEMQTRAMFSFGLWKRPWEDVQVTEWPSIGAFTSRPFDPFAWREAYPYWPFAEMDLSDGYWGAKLVMRFSRPMVEAIVAEGKLTDPRAARYLVDTLLARRDAIGRAYFEAVSPLDDFELTRDQLCMNDLSVRNGFAASGTVEWLDGSSVTMERALPATGRLCVALPKTDAYTVYRMRVRRGSDRHLPLELHFKGGENARILGLVRVAG